MLPQLYPFQTPFLDKNLYGDVLGNNRSSSPCVLFLHGAGQANRHRFLPFREGLYQQYGIGSCAFDFIGHGETGGELLSSSLQQRTAQAQHIIEKYCTDCTALHLIGASMSAYTAVKLTQSLQVASLTLMVPAAYDQRAYTVPFGDAFSKILRQPHSWKASDVWGILSTFTGNVHLVVAALDNVIPSDLIDRLYQSVSHPSAQCTKTVLADSSHQCLNFLNHQPDALQQLISDTAMLIG